MPLPEDIYVDGALQVPDLTVTINGTLYQLEGFKRSAGTVSKKVRAGHKKLGGVYAKGDGSWSGTAIAENDAEGNPAPAPAELAKFSARGRNFIITNVDETAEGEDVMKWSITADELTHPIAP